MFICVFVELCYLKHDWLAVGQLGQPDKSNLLSDVPLVSLDHC